MILLICGAGQYGAVAKETAEALGIYSKILFADDKSDAASCRLSEIGGVEYDEACIAIGNPDIREELFGKIRKPATLIHPKAVVMPSAKIGMGSIVEAGAVISSNASVGNSCIIMSNSVIGHNAKIGDFCQLKYGCVIPEGCVVASKRKIGCNEVYSEA